MTRQDKIKQNKTKQDTRHKTQDTRHKTQGKARQDN